MYQATVDEWLQDGQAALQGGQTLDTRQAFCTLLLNCTVHPFGFAELVFFFRIPHMCTVLEATRGQTSLDSTHLTILHLLKWAPHCFDGSVLW